MARELLDKVDTNDKVIGITDREEAHKKGFIHRVVVVYVFSPDGQLYVQRVGKNKLYDHSVGGHVIKGELYDDAAKREAYEELGIRQPLNFIGNVYSDETYTHSNYRHMYAIYKTQVTAAWQFMPNEEVAQIEVLPIQKITKLMHDKPSLFTAGFIKTAKYYLAAK